MKKLDTASLLSAVAAYEAAVDASLQLAAKAAAAKDDAVRATLFRGADAMRLEAAAQRVELYAAFSALTESATRAFDAMEVAANVRVDVRPEEVRSWDSL